MLTIDVKMISPEVIKKRIELAQKTLDDAVIGDSAQYVPHRKGGLRESVNSYSKVGEGLIVYPGPYAHYQYEGMDMIGVESQRHWAKKDETKIYNGKVLHYHKQGTGARWFEKAKEKNLNKWCRMVGRILDGRQ